MPTTTQSTGGGGGGVPTEFRCYGEEGGAEGRSHTIRTKTRGHGRPSGRGENSRGELWSKDVKSFWIIPQIKHTSSSVVRNQASHIWPRNEKSFFWSLHLLHDRWNVPFGYTLCDVTKGSYQFLSQQTPSKPLRPDLFLVFPSISMFQRSISPSWRPRRRRSILMGGCKQRANYAASFLIIENGTTLFQTWKTYKQRRCTERRSLGNKQQRLWRRWQVSIRSPLGGGERATSILHDTMTQQLHNTNGPFCAFKIRALLTNKGQYLPLSAPRPLGGGQIGAADQIMNSWPDVGVKWTRRCHRDGNLFHVTIGRLLFRLFQSLDNKRL